ncbi:hypothetical protein Ptr902_09308 [Pyrenophora tritici-repentis]|nr:hypothetical protein Ptr902_09308 [Pyrenophora tritici-repentis]
MVTPPTPPKASWKDPYYSWRGHSPLRHEYKVTRTSEVDSNTTASGASAHHNLSVSHLLGTMSSPGSTNSTSTAAHNLLDTEQEDPEDYDPEYATYLAATIQSQAEKEDLEEYKEFYCIQTMLDRKKGLNERLALKLSDRRLRDAIGRA